MDRASGEWYLSIDADEWLDGDISELTDFLLGSRGEACSAADLVVRSYTTYELAGYYIDKVPVQTYRLLLFVFARTAGKAGGCPVLEHTQNNLSVMKENIQDAESTIRDTDVAEEMMAYTKNNILVQSAQAMLAQANQIPQGVLQLLG